jgi:hypothetical protein
VPALATYTVWFLILMKLLARAWTAIDKAHLQRRA